MTPVENRESSLLLSIGVTLFAATYIKYHEYGPLMVIFLIHYAGTGYNLLKNILRLDFCVPHTCPTYM